ncbi:MAG: T9SS type A sorting domain-containing protein [Bacteroidetes bacterium]|nr:T9SS type A sorting domain-containing protein [Bacteroidota bacterium]
MKQTPFAFGCRPVLLCFLSVMLLTPRLVIAQNEWCGTMHRTNQLIEQDLNYATQFEDFKNHLRDLADAYAVSNREVQANPIIYIPVVFHIVHNGDAIGTGENISDEQVISQLPALDRDFNGLDPDQVNVPQPFQALVGNVGFKFCLAKFDPDGNPTTGIIRHQFAQTTWNTETDIDQNLKPATIWDRNRYLNIWSVRMGGDLASNGVLAYSSFPFFGNANADGIVARYNTVGTTGSIMAGFQKGKTLSHEAGHYFGLLHTWGTGPGCGDQGDFVADTPDQDDLNFGCPAFPRVSCANSAPNGDMFMNYMDYSDDDCRNMFTLGQTSNMRGIIDGFRTALKTASTQCFYNLDASIVKAIVPKDTICSLNFTPVVILKNEGQTTLTSATFYFQIDGGGVQVFNWSGSIASQSELGIFLPAQSVAAGAHTFDVSVGSVNSQASDNFAGNNEAATTFYAYAGSAAGSIPVSEGFENGLPVADWSILNPNSDATWEPEFYGAYGLSSACMKIDNFSYLTNPNKKKDAIITAAWDLSAATNPELKFDVAYARRDSIKSDSLNVYYSLNCGSSWTKIWNQKGSELATAPNQTTLFTPSPSDWKTVTIPLSGLGGFSKVSFKFENVTGWGNVLYLDNVNITNSIALAVNNPSEDVVNIYPNPASGLISVRLPFSHPYHTVSVLNYLGKVVAEQKVLGSALIFDLHDNSNGVYFIQLKGNSTVRTQKIIIAH